MLRDPARAAGHRRRSRAAAADGGCGIGALLLLLPRGLFERIGGFDEGYRLHAEDLDLCRRARRRALVACANDVRVLRARVSRRARPLFVEWHKHRGFWRYFGKFGRRAGVRGCVRRCSR